MTQPDSSTRRWTRLGLVAPLVAAALAGAFVFPHVHDTSGDQEVYALAARRAAAGEQFYRPDQERAFTYPPFCVLWFLPLYDLPELVRRGACYAINAALLVAVIAIVCRELDPMERPGGPPGWLCVGAVTLLAARFVISPIEYQGHDQLVFLLTLLAIVAWSRSRHGAAGFWAGVGAATKATPALLLLVFLWNRHRRAAAWGLATLVGLTFLPDLLVPSADGRPWVAAWYGAFLSKIDVGTAADANGAWNSWNLLNQSLAGTLYRLSTHVPVNSPVVFDVNLWSITGAALKGVTLVLQIGVLGAIAYATRPAWTAHVDERERRILRMGQGAAVVCGMLLLSPMSSKAHFCSLLLPIAFVVSDFLYRRRDMRVGLALGVVLVLGTATAKDLVGESVGDALLAYGSLTWCTLACLFAVSRAVAQRSSELAARALVAELGREEVVRPAAGGSLASRRRAA